MVNLAQRLARPTATIAFADNGGAGPAVVLTHGAGLDNAMFDAQADALKAQGYRVIHWDLRGHGQSTLADGVRFRADDALDDLGALLDACELEPATLVGHSLGGNLVQAFARRHPERVRGLIVLDSTWNDGPLSVGERLGLKLAAPSLALIPARSLPSLMARASAVTPDAIERARATFARMPKRTFLDVWRATVSLVRPQPDRRSPVPLALMRGDRDQTGNIEAAMTRWAAAEGIAVDVIEQAGHIVTWDAPAASTRALLRVLERWDAAA